MNKIFIYEMKGRINELTITPALLKIVVLNTIFDTFISCYKIGKINKKIDINDNGLTAS